MAQRIGRPPQPRRACIIESCGKPQHGHGYCDKHYRRLLNVGDPVGGTREKVPNGTTCIVEYCRRLHFKRGHCQPHYKRLLKYGDPLGGPPLPEHIDVDGKRLCSKCGERKPLEEFDKSPSGRGGRGRNCKACVKLRADAWYQANREAVLERSRQYYIKREYGEAGFEVARRRTAGDGCDVCGSRTGRMVIDHCHVTGIVRGLLCNPCNLVLGAVGDDPERLRSLALYLERYLFPVLSP